MILTDEVNIVYTNDVLANGAVMTDAQVASRVTIPAQVAFRSVQDDADSTHLYYQSQALVMQIEPLETDLDPAHHNVEWRGKRYALDGQALVRRRHGSDHHWTVQLDRS